MRRRDFITLLGGAAATWPLAVRAQQPAMPVIGFLEATTAADTIYRVSAFRDGLKEAGFIDGHNVAIEFRWAENKFDRLPALAADLVHRQVAAIVGQNTTMRAARAATSTIPIVFVSGGDPVATGLVTNLSRPGGNITGVSFAGTPLQPKRLALLHELVPPPATIAWLRNPSNPSFEIEERDVNSAARELGRHLLSLDAESPREIDAAFATMVQSRAGALLIGSGVLWFPAPRTINLKAGHLVPRARLSCRRCKEKAPLRCTGAGPKYGDENIFAEGICSSSAARQFGARGMVPRHGRREEKPRRNGAESKQ